MKSFSGDFGKKCRSAVPASSRLTAQTDGKGKPELRGVTHCCLRCCLDHTTRFLQYISHNAYIYVAVHDLTFTEGARQAFELTLRNIGQVSVLTAGERVTDHSITQRSVALQRAPLTAPISSSGWWNEGGRRH